MPDRSLDPVIVGVGDAVNRSLRVESAMEPMQLMMKSILSSLKDTALPSSLERELTSSIDSINVIATWTWPYADLPGLISAKLGMNPQHKTYSAHGGNQPIRLIDEAARRIADGETRVAIVTGGEALASHLGTIHSIGLPIHVYPLYENAYRAHHGQSIMQNNTESAQLYTEFAKIAHQNEFAWNFRKDVPTERSIKTVTDQNRMICFPYPLLMNAFNNVNLAASCILTSTDYARELGIPENKWIYPLGGAGTQDSDNFWERPDFHSNPSISRSLDACLKVSGLDKNQINLYDIYSCFPIVPKLACQYLGLPSTNSPKPITLLGGLTSFGGAGNNYSLHSLTAMVRQLRKGNDQHGLVLANGGVLTYQHAICLSSQPRNDGCAYPSCNPLPPYINDIVVPQISAQASGEAIIETYTVEYNRNGTPSKGFVVGRLTSNNYRFIANHGDSKTLEQLCSRTREPIGRAGKVTTGDDGRNLFTFGLNANL